MIDSSLVSLLKKFDKQQLKDFNNFVKSPFFNTNKAIVKLYEYIRKQYPDYESSKLEKEYVFKKVFGKTEYNDGFLRVLMSNLQTLAEDYLIHKSVSGDKFMRGKYLLDELSMLGERKLAEKVLNREIKAITDIPITGPDEYLGLYYLAFYQKYFYSTRFVVNKGNKPDEGLYDEQKYLTYHFLLRALSNHFYHLNQSQVISYQPQLLFLDEIIIFLNNHPEFLESHVLNITFLRVMLMKNNDLKDFYKLKHTFFEIFDKVQHKDSFNTISIIINYCQRNYSLTDDILFMKEKFEMLKFGLEHKLHRFELTEGFDGGRFNNIVGTALEFGEIEWAEAFLSEFSKELDDAASEFLIPYLAASIEFSKKNFDESLAILSKIKNPAAVTDKFNLKVLQLKLYYEMDFIDQAESAADAFRHLIQNDKVLPELYKESQKNFYHMYLKLLLIIMKGKGQTSDELRDIISDLKPVANKKWLLEKIPE